MGHLAHLDAHDVIVVVLGESVVKVVLVEISDRNVSVLGKGVGLPVGVNGSLDGPCEVVAEILSADLIELGGFSGGDRVAFLAKAAEDFERESLNSDLADGNVVDHFAHSLLFFLALWPLSFCWGR